MKKRIIKNFYIILICLLILIGVTFALFAVNFIGQKQNIIDINGLTFRYTEEDAAIELIDPEGLSDAEGIQQETYFDFNIYNANTYNYAITYNIYLKEGINNNLNTNYVKVYLTDQSNTQIVPVSTISSLVNYPNDTDSYLLYTNTITPDALTNNQTHYYRLRIWLDENYTDTITQTTVNNTQTIEITDKKFSFKVSVDNLTYQADETRPTITSVTVPSEESTTRKAITVAASDNVGVRGYLITNSNEIPLLTDDWNITSATTWVSDSVYTNGTYYVWVKDGNNNISLSTSVVVSNVKVSIPVCTWTGPSSNNIFNGETATYILTCIDEDNEEFLDSTISLSDIVVSNSNVVLLSEPVKAPLLNNAGYTYTFTLTAKNSNGSVYLVAKKNVVTDSDENTNLTSNKSSVLTVNGENNPPDTTNPTCVITENDSINWTKSKTLTLVGTDAGGISPTGYSFDGITYSSVTTHVITTNGTYTGYVKDNAGNIGTCSVTVTKADSTAPVISSASYTTTNNNDYISYTATDSNTGIKGYLVSTNSTTPTENDLRWIDNNNSNVLATVESYPEGRYYVFVKDNLGNISSYYEVITDVTAPTCSISVSPAGEIHTSIGKTLTITSTDTDLASSPYSFDDITYSDINTNQVNINGTYTGYVKDNVGNVGSCTIAVTTIYMNFDTSGAEEPQLVDGMIPVYYDGDNWRKADSTNASSNYKWYNYNNKQWANAVTVTASNRTTIEDSPLGTAISMDDINTMWVWIPRYSYTIKSEDGTNYYGNGGTSAASPGSIDIKFVDTSTTETGTAQYSGATATNYYTHPSFWWDSDDDGVRDTNEEKAGIWFAKFETSHNTLASSTTKNNLGCTDTSCANGSGIIIKPDVPSLRRNDVSNYFLGARSMQVAHYNTYGFPNNTTYDVHMIKNDEWGAAAYLAQSIYGRCSSATSCTEVYINNSLNISDYLTYTGRSGGNVPGSTPINGTYTGQTSTAQYNTYGFYTYDGYLLEYNTNTKSVTRDMSKVASTTGNIYGIYDMSGGTWEKVMGNYNDYSGYNTTYNSGFNGILYNGGPKTDGINFFGITSNNKYYNKYPNPPFTGTYATNTTFCTQATCGGHALNETAGWYGDYSSFVYSSDSWFYRGGYSSDTSYAGMFTFYYGSGYAYGRYGSRCAIVK